MSWLIARTFGVLAVAAALTTSHASALAASPAINSPHYATKLKKTSTLVGLSPQMNVGR